MPKSKFPGDDKSALEIIRELTAGADHHDESHEPLPVSVHTRSLSAHNPRPDPLLSASAEGEEQPFANEIDSLQFALQRIQLSFPRVSSIEEQLQLASAMNLITSSLARMVRTQKYITANRPTEYNRQIQAALDVVMKEWTRSP